MNRFLSRRTFSVLALVAAGIFGQANVAQAADEAADVFIKRVSSDILEAIKADKSIHSGDVNKIIVLVDQRVMPNVNFLRMTASAVGPGWRQATPEQQKRLQEEFKILLVRTYAGALGEVSDQAISVKPLRAAADDKEVLVRTEVRGKGDPIQLDYRVEKTADGAWKVYNMNVMGIWLVENYKTQFAQEINAKGVDGLIASWQIETKPTPKLLNKAMTATHTSVALPAVLMQAQAQAVKDELAPLLGACVSEGGEAVLDASALTQFDSSALAVILACRRAVLARGAHLRIKGLPERAQALAKVYGLNDLIQ